MKGIILRERDFELNDEQKRIVFGIDSLALIKKDESFYTVAKEELLKGTFKTLTKREALVAVSVLSDYHEQYILNKQQ